MEFEKVEADNLTQQQMDFIEVESHCCLCGTELIFTHELDDTASQVTEQAQCPCCNILMKEKEFSIQ